MSAESIGMHQSEKPWRWEWHPHPHSRTNTHQHLKTRFSLEQVSIRVAFAEAIRLGSQSLFPFGVEAQVTFLRSGISGLGGSLKTSPASLDRHKWHDNVVRHAVKARHATR